MDKIFQSLWVGRSLHHKCKLIDKFWHKFASLFQIIHTNYLSKYPLPLALKKLHFCEIPISLYPYSNFAPIKKSCATFILVIFQFTVYLCIGKWQIISLKLHILTNVSSTLPVKSVPKSAADYIQQPKLSFKLHIKVKVKLF